LAECEFWDALYAIPITIAENAGHHPLDVRLLLSNDLSSPTTGVDIESGELCDMKDKGVVEPRRVVSQAIQSATEVAIAILRIDDIIGKRGDDAGPSA